MALYQHPEKGTKIFNAIMENWKLRDSLGLSSDPSIANMQFNNKVSNLNSALYNFIKVQ